MVVVHLHQLILVVHILIDNDIIILLFFFCGDIVFLFHSVINFGLKRDGSISMFELYTSFLDFKAHSLTLFIICRSIDYLDGRTLLQ